MHNLNVLHYVKSSNKYIYFDAVQLSFEKNLSVTQLYCHGHTRVPDRWLFNVTLQPRIPNSLCFKHLGIKVSA